MSTWSVKTRPGPSRHGSDARVYGHRITAISQMSTPPLPTPVAQRVPWSWNCMQVVLVNTGNADKSLDRKVRVRAVWYVLLAALEDVETQRRGFCFVVTLKTAKITQVR